MGNANAFKPTKYDIVENEISVAVLNSVITRVAVSAKIPTFLFATEYCAAFT